MTKNQDLFSLPIPQFTVHVNENAGLSHKDKITRARSRLFHFMPFYGDLISKCTVTVVPDENTLCQTAQIDAFGNIKFAESFMAQLSVDRLIGVLCHEVMHVALECFYRSLTYDKVVISIGHDGVPRPAKLFNLAQDFCINYAIVESIKSLGTANRLSINLPENGLYHTKYAGMSSEEIYALLDQDIQGNDPVPYFMVDMDMSGPASNDGDPNQDSDQITPTEIREAREQWKQAVVEAVLRSDRNGQNQGIIPAVVRKYVHELLNPRVYWVDVVSRWMGEHGSHSNRTYRRPGRRTSALNITMKQAIPSDISDVCVLLDTSGSMGGREQELVSETIAISEDLGLSLRVICIDSAIHSDVSDVTDVSQISFIGGGGSDFSPAFKRLDEERYDGIVIAFTDGYIGVPSSPPPTIKATLWVLFSEHHDKAPAPWGEVVKIDPDGYTHVF